MKIAIGGDHAGYNLKEQVKTYLTSLGYQIKDFGPFSDERCDYPDIAHPVADAVEGNEVDLGILMCGSGNGISMTANKHRGIRCALCWIPEIAELARQHNDANICAMPARYVSFDEAKAIVSSFLNASFEGGRHTARVEKIPC